jgi:transcriptional regulator with XRE-family HTH domain
VETDPIRVFGKVLRSVREQAGLSQRELAERVYCSPSLISAVELGNKPAKKELVECIDTELSAKGILVMVWPITTSGSYPSEFVASMESEAAKIHDWEPRIIPGLLQTPEYARGVMRAARPFDKDDSIELDVSVRSDRQNIFTRDNPPMTWFVIDESVFYRPFGGKTIMRDQLMRLEKLADQPNIIIQVMRLAATGHPGTEGPLRIIEFTDSPAIWYTEGWYSGRMTEAKNEVASAKTYFDLIRASALPPDRSMRFIANVRNSRYE